MTLPPGRFSPRLPGGFPNRRTPESQGLDVEAPTTVIPTGELRAPSELSHYRFVVSRDRQILSVNPQDVQRPMTRGASRGVIVEDNIFGGKDIQLEGGPFRAYRWVTASFRELVSDPRKQATLRAARYDLDRQRPLLVVTGDNDPEPTILAFSAQAGDRGVVAVCSEVTTFDFNGSGGGGGMVTIRKPVVYLYPTEPTEVTVKVEIDGPFAAQYPKADADGTWRMVATPDGTLFDRRNERRYTYLFWEGLKSGGFELDPTRAFCVSSEQAQALLERFADAHALNDRERTDFVSYWLPALELNPYSLVQLLDEPTYERYARMEVTPAPDRVIRLFMIFRAFDQPVAAGDPELPNHHRAGFTVVEWGGCNLDDVRR